MARDNIEQASLSTVTLQIYGDDILSFYSLLWFLLRLEQYVNCIELNCSSQTFMVIETELYVNGNNRLGCIKFDFMLLWPEFIKISFHLSHVEDSHKNVVSC